MFHKIKALIHEVIDFLSSGESGAVKNRNGRIVGVHDGGPNAWSMFKFIFLFLIMSILIIDVFYPQKPPKTLKGTEEDLCM